MCCLLLQVTHAANRLFQSVPHCIPTISLLLVMKLILNVTKVISVVEKITENVKQITNGVVMIPHVPVRNLLTAKSDQTMCHKS